MHHFDISVSAQPETFQSWCPPRREIQVSHWDNLHLHTIKPILGEWASSNRPTRREEVLLTRLRMDCTLPTHNASIHSPRLPTIVLHM
ncbi:hypothetical protein E2C01_025705 [Portunus trituberculatus]|uniref:Uncharacterized protein n=1 Tax=Portunus trituberculatus TaxID=210409 RepID=A0A5B7EG80_PORTR|nr:hypothetical protein [Portunus trituberculatus]